MMNRLHSVLVILSMAFLRHSLAFSLGHMCNRQSYRPLPSTCLFAEGEDASSSEASQQQDIPEPKTDAATDILNSPAFLKRKLDVLKSEIAKIDEEIAAAKQRLEEGKAEWAGQLDELQKEVSSPYGI